jgi:hypothetical protein
MLLLALCVVFSCKQKTATKSSKLSGKYAVVGFKVKTDMEKRWRPVDCRNRW